MTRSESPPAPGRVHRLRRLAGQHLPQLGDFERRRHLLDVAFDARLRDIEADLERQAMSLPNFPAAGTPDGDASANRIVRTWGEPPKFDFQPKPHWDLAATLGILDLAAGAKLTGSGFVVFRGLGAKLGRALAAASGGAPAR